MQARTNRHNLKTEKIPLLYPLFSLPVCAELLVKRILQQLCSPRSNCLDVESSSSLFRPDTLYQIHH